jgi:energy-converting hydrogenase Eha subunit E
VPTCAAPAAAAALVRLLLLLYVAVVGVCCRLVWFLQMLALIVFSVFWVAILVRK